MILILGLVALSHRVQAQNNSGVYAIKGARVYTLAGPPMENATVVIRDGKIAAIGATVDVPAGAQVIDARGGTTTYGYSVPGCAVEILRMLQIATGDSRHLCWNSRKRML